MADIHKCNCDKEDMDSIVSFFISEVVETKKNITDSQGSAKDESKHISSNVVCSKRIKMHENKY